MNEEQIRKFYIQRAETEMHLMLNRAEYDRLHRVQHQHNLSCDHRLPSGVYAREPEMTFICAICRCSVNFDK